LTIQKQGAWSVINRGKTALGWKGQVSPRGGFNKVDEAPRGVKRSKKDQQKKAEKKWADEGVKNNPGGRGGGGSFLAVG